MAVADGAKGHGGEKPQVVVAVATADDHVRELPVQWDEFVAGFVNVVFHR